MVMLLGRGLILSLRVVLACLTLTVGLGQTATPGAAAGVRDQGIEEFVLRSETQLIQVSVIVTDRNGDPVKDLKQSDFEILDRGKPVPVAFFSEESSEKRERAPAGLPPNIFSNRIGSREGNPTSVTAIVLDALNTPLLDQAYARSEILKFLKQLRPDDRVALYVLGSSLRILHDYTSDTNSLLKILDRQGPQLLASLRGSDRSFDEMTKRLIDDFPELELQEQLRQMQDRQAVFYTNQRVQATLIALGIVAEHVSALPGRKNVVWVSSGFPLRIGLEDVGDSTQTLSRHLRSFTAEVESTLRLINQANVALYPVDAAGLIGSPLGNASAPLVIRGRAATNLQSDINTRHEVMRLAAQRTGGRASLNNNDIQWGIRRALDDSRASYSLSFYPSALDNKWHDLKVRVHRPGVEVRHRNGYLAQAQEKPTEVTRQAAMRSAAWSPLDATFLPVSARIDLDQGGEALDIVVQLNVTSIALRPNADRLSGFVHLRFVQKDTRGEAVHEAETKLDVNVRPEEFRKLMDSGLLYRQKVPKHAKLHTLKVIAFDGNTGRVGSVSASLSRIQAGSAAPLVK